MRQRGTYNKSISSGDNEEFCLFVHSEGAMGDGNMAQGLALSKTGQIGYSCAITSWVSILGSSYNNENKMVQFD